MKLQDEITGVVDAFRGFKRINEILANNWTDTNMQAFSESHLIPIDANGQKHTQEAQNHLVTIDKSIENLEQQIADIDHTIRFSRDAEESVLEGCLVCHCYVHDQIGNSMMKGFLIPKEKVPYANDQSMLWSIACDRLPYYDDYDHFMLNEYISLR